MSITVSDIINLSDGYVGDKTYLNITESEKLAAATEACVWLLEKTLTDHALKTATLEYIPGIHRYKISSSIPDILDGSDLRRIGSLQVEPATKKSVREMYEDISSESTEFAYGLERSMDGTYILINLQNDYTIEQVLSLTNLTTDGGTITAIGDAVNLQNSTYKIGESVRFDINGSGTDDYSGINIALGSNKDLSNYDLNGTFMLDVYVPELMTLDSITLHLVSSTDSLILATTTDATGDTIYPGEQTLLFKVSSSSSAMNILSDIESIQIRFNHDAGYPATAGILVRDLRITTPEDLKLAYVSQYIGTSSTGTKLLSYSALTDIPFFSGTYDSYKFAVARKMSSIIFRELRLGNESNEELKLATDALIDKQKLFPSSVTKEDRTFKMKGVNFNRRKF